VTQPTGSPPLVYTDARFNSNVASSSITLQRGATVENKSITDTGATASRRRSGHSIGTAKTVYSTAPRSRGRGRRDFGFRRRGVTKFQAIVSVTSASFADAINLLVGLGTIR
jgi:hypothetical protein